MVVSVSSISCKGSKVIQGETGKRDFREGDVVLRQSLTTKTVFSVREIVLKYILLENEKVNHITKTLSRYHKVHNY